MSQSSQRTAAVHLEPWGPDDLRLLERLFGDPAMMAHLGGPESPEKIAVGRHGFAILLFLIKGAVRPLQQLF